MKKRIFTFFLALMLMLSMTIPAFAYSRTDFGTYGNCQYHAVTTCNQKSWHSLIEVTDCSDDILNYNLLVDVYSYDSATNLKQITLGQYSTIVSTNSVSVSYSLHHINAYYRINGDTVLGPVTSYAS